MNLIAEKLLGAKAKKITEDAQKWLESTIANNRSYKNFEVIELLDAWSSVGGEGIIFKFSCRYIWTLNAWDKNVEGAMFYVVYDVKKDTFRGHDSMLSPL